MTALIFPLPFLCKRESRYKTGDRFETCLRLDFDRSWIPACARITQGRTIPAFVLLAFALSGCVQAPVENTIKPAWETRRDVLMQLETWDLKGRIAVRADNESGSGTLYWTQRNDEYDIRVIASFSGGVYELSGGAGVVSLRTPDKSVLQAGDAETLLRQAAGWYFPVSDLVYWIRGLPTPALQVDQLLLDGENRVSALSQAGWSIRYKNYVGVDGASMPTRLDLENDHVRVRLSIREWNLP